METRNAAMAGSKKWIGGGVLAAVLLAPVALMDGLTRR